MSKKGGGISMSIGGTGYSLGSAGGGSRYSLVGSGGGYSLAGSSKGYSLTNRINDSSRMGYSSITPRGYANAGIKMKGYSIRQSLYGPVTLFPVPYGRLPDPLDEARRLYKKKCPSCGNESRGSGSYSLN